MSDDPPSRSYSVSPDVLKAVVDAFYPDTIRGASTARTRAAAAQSVTSLIVAGLLGFISLSALQDQPLILRSIGFIAMLLWAIASWLYVWAVSAPASEQATDRLINSEDALVARILDQAEADVKEIDRRQKKANAFVLAALIATIATFAYSIFIPDSRWVDAILVPTDQQRAGFRIACPEIPAGGPLRVRTDAASMSKPTIALRLNCKDRVIPARLAATGVKDRLVLIDG